MDNCDIKALMDFDIEHISDIGIFDIYALDTVESRDNIKLFLDSSNRQSIYNVVYIKSGSFAGNMLPKDRFLLLLHSDVYKPFKGSSTTSHYDVILSEGEMGDTQ